MRVRLGALVRETLRAARSRPVWALATVLWALAVGGVCAALVASDAGAVAARQERLDARGWGLLQVSDAAGGTLDPQVCSAITQLDGVHRSGAVGGSAERSALGVAAGLAVTAVTPQVVEIAWPGAFVGAPSGALLTPGFARLSGAGSGVLSLDVGGAFVPVPVTQLTGAGRDASLDGGVLTVRPDLHEATRCLVEVDGEEAEERSLEIATAVVSTRVIVVPLLSTNDAAPTPGDLVRDHHDRRYPLLAGLLLAAGAGLRLLTSRRDRAVYRLLGLGRGDLWLMGLVDVLTVVIVPATSAFTTGLLLAELGGTTTRALGPIDVVMLQVAVTATALGYATISAAGRNTHQFAPGA